MRRTHSHYMSFNNPENPTDVPGEPTRKASGALRSRWNSSACAQIMCSHAQMSRARAPSGTKGESGAYRVLVEILAEEVERQCECTVGVRFAVGLPAEAREGVIGTGIFDSSRVITRS